MILMEAYKQLVQKLIIKTTIIGLIVIFFIFCTTSPASGKKKIKKSGLINNTCIIIAVKTSKYLYTVCFYISTDLMLDEKSLQYLYVNANYLNHASHCLDH